MYSSVSFTTGKSHDFSKVFLFFSFSHFFKVNTVWQRSQKRILVSDRSSVFPLTIYKPELNRRKYSWKSHLFLLFHINLNFLCKKGALYKLAISVSKMLILRENRKDLKLLKRHNEKRKKKTINNITFKIIYEKFL